MNNWVLLPELQQLQADFGQLDTVFSLQGERITKDPISDLIKLERQGVVYYVKRYYTAGRGIRAFDYDHVFKLNGKIYNDFNNGVYVVKKCSLMVCNAVLAHLFVALLSPKKFKIAVI